MCLRNVSRTLTSAYYILQFLWWNPMEVDSGISLSVCLARVSFTAEQALRLSGWHLDRWLHVSLPVRGRPMPVGPPWSLLRSGEERFYFFHFNRWSLSGSSGRSFLSPCFPASGQSLKDSLCAFLHKVLNFGSKRRICWVGMLLIHPVAAIWAPRLEILEVI